VTEPTERAPDGPEHGWERWGPDAHDDLIRAVLAGQTPEEVAARFGRTVNAVRQRLAKLYLIAGLRERGADDDTIHAWVWQGPLDVPETLRTSVPLVHAWASDGIDTLCEAIIRSSTRTSDDPDDVTCPDCRAHLPEGPE
jgi:hypothetical protein